MKKLLTYNESRGTKGKCAEQIDYYEIYKNPNYYLNRWFIGFNKKVKKYLIDEIVTVKQTDEKTSLHLYNKNINPVILRISDYTNYNKNCYMTATIFSIDDTCYTIEFYKELNILFEIRDNLVDYLDKLELINGDDFLNKCIELGADDKTISYS